MHKVRAFVVMKNINVGFRGSATGSAAYVSPYFFYSKAMSNIYINGVLDKTQYFDIENKLLMSTNHDYDIGLDRNASTSLNAYLHDLIVFNWTTFDNRVQKRMGKGIIMAPRVHLKQLVSFDHRLNNS